MTEQETIDIPNREDLGDIHDRYTDNDDYGDYDYPFANCECCETELDESDLYKVWVKGEERKYCKTCLKNGEDEFQAELIRICDLNEGLIKEFVKSNPKKFEDELILTELEGKDTKDKRELMKKFIENNETEFKVFCYNAFFNSTGIFVVSPYYEKRKLKEQYDMRKKIIMTNIDETEKLKSIIDEAGV
jgi:hypothetical protein